MTNFERLGEELRGELGEPPAGWTEQQRKRLRAVDLAPAPDRRPFFLAAAVAAVALLVGGFYYWPSTQQASTASVTDQPDDASPVEAQPLEQAPGEALWVEANTEATTRPLQNGGQMTLAAGGRGRLDQRSDHSTRFDLHQGVATFDVHKQEGKEFSVVAGEYRVMVVGTRFVTAYVPPRELNVSVQEGAVQIFMPHRSAPINVDAGEVLEIEGQEFSLRKEGENLASPDAAASPDLGTGAKQAKGTGSAAASWQELYRDGQYREACESARSDSLAKLNGTLAAPAMIDLANTLRLCGDTSGALGILASVRQRHAGSAQAHEALFLMGRIHATSGQSAAAITELEQYLSGAGGGRFAAESLGRLIELHEAAGNRQKARAYSERYLKLSPQGPYRRLAESVSNVP